MPDVPEKLEIQCPGCQKSNTIYPKGLGERKPTCSGCGRQLDRAGENPQATPAPSGSVSASGQPGSAPTAGGLTSSVDPKAKKPVSPAQVAGVACAGLVLFIGMLVYNLKHGHKKSEPTSSNATPNPATRPDPTVTSPEIEQAERDLADLDQQMPTAETQKKRAAAALNVAVLRLKKKVELLRTQGKTIDAEAAEATAKDSSKAQAAEDHYQRDAAAWLDDIVTRATNGDKNASIQLVITFKNQHKDANLELEVARGRWQSAIAYSTARLEGYTNSKKALDRDPKNEVLRSTVEQEKRASDEAQLEARKCLTILTAWSELSK